MIEITKKIQISEKELEFEFVRASGPGGQNVNKVATCAKLYFDILNSESLLDEIKARLLNKPDGRITKNGVLIIEAKRFRTQEANKNDAIDRLIKFIISATKIPKKRKKTKPTKASQERRIQSKVHKGKIKKLRKSVAKDFE
ncbi:MAG: alternative ribosome rescue aminoacyl-tRNA hydrolase ArfB [Pseudomonadota bacterium]